MWRGKAADRRSPRHQTPKIKDPRLDLDKTWHGLIEFRVRDEQATTFPQEWEEGGQPHLAQSLSEMLDWYRSKWNEGMFDVDPRTGLEGQIMALTACRTGSSRMVGCIDHLNHSGFRVEIIFAKALLPDLPMIEAGVNHLLDIWSS